jgi:hypothetical protein
MDYGKYLCIYKMPIDIFGRTNNTGARAAQKAPSLYLDTKHFLRHDGSVPVSSALNMDGNAIKNLPFPAEQTDATNREYVDVKINHLDQELRRYIDRIVSEKVNEAVGIAFNSIGSYS